MTMIIYLIMRKIASTILIALISFSFFSFANSADKKLKK